MTAKQRDECLYQLLRAMRFAKEDSRQYDLQVIGESLIGEYRDLNYKEVSTRIVQTERSR